VLRPWPASDGSLLRLRLAGGRLPASSLRELLAVAARYGDGQVHVTGRANLQVRAFPAVTEEIVAAIEATGLLPSRTHELARNLMASPQTGLAGGRADLRPVVAELDRLLCAAPALGALPGRFLFVLDDGRGDLLDRPVDLGIVVLDADSAQVRIGSSWGPVVPLEAAPATLVDLAHAFLAVRSTEWHVDELVEPPGVVVAPDPRLPEQAPPLAFGQVAGGSHVAAIDGVIDPALASYDGDLIVTPWQGILVPEAGR
jgi:precorrin-3B synthase